MNSLTGMQTALTLLSKNPLMTSGLSTSSSNQNQGQVMTAKAGLAVMQPEQRQAGLAEAGLTQEQQERSEAQIKEFLGVMTELRDGSLSPLSDRALKSGIYGVGRPPPSPDSDPRMMEEGVFAYSSESAASTTAGQAKFADRQVAMLNAYHYGSELSEYGQGVAAYANAEAERQSRLDAIDTIIAKGGVEGQAAKAYKGQLSEFVGGGHTRELASAQRGMDRASAMLKSQFGFTVDVVQEDAEGQSSFQGFEVRHETFGLMMRVNAGGEVTLYGADGQGHSASTYNAAHAEAVIPELHNDQIRRADSEASWQEKLARMEDRVSRLEDHRGVDIRR